MCAQVSPSPENALTFRALVRPVVAVSSGVCGEVLRGGEARGTAFEAASVWLVVHVKSFVDDEQVGSAESSWTMKTFVRFEAGMRDEV